MEIQSKIDYWLERASSSLFNQGLEWYSATKEWTEDIANQYEIDQKKVTGILSALSVMKEFSYNQKLVVEFLECQTCGHLSQQILKCQKIYNLENPSDNDVISILSGRKTQSFYHNICYPTSSEKLTVDFRIWKFFKKNEWNSITNKRWDEMEKVFREKSLENKVTLPQLQAIVWLITKNNKNVI